MKSISRLSILGMFLLLGLAATQPASAQSANGIYTFTTQELAPKRVDFDSKAGANGGGDGRLAFADDAKKVDPDVDGTGERVDPAGPFTMTVSFDAMQVEKNRAIMNGVIRDSSHPTYVGRWVQLMVEDNGLNNRETPDQLVWRVCRPEQGGWVPEDSEVKGDDGAYRSWWATDAERRDDVGIPSRNIIPGQTRNCQNYNINSYSYAGVTSADGDIVVNP